MKLSSVDFAQLLSDLFYCDRCEQCLADYRRIGICKVLNDSKELSISPENFYTDYPYIAAYVKCRFHYTKCTDCVFQQIEYNGICTRTRKKGCQAVDKEMERLMQSGQEWKIINPLTDVRIEDAPLKGTIVF